MSKFCGEDDVITPISPDDEALRTALNYPGPRNFAGYYNHIAAKLVRQRLGKKWDDYYSFCVERNPWDRVVSLYYYLHQTDKRPDIADFVLSPAINVLKERGSQLYRIDGEIVVDRVCCYERLDQEMEFVAERLALPGPVVLPRAKAGLRDGRSHYRDLLNDQCRERVAQMFADEIELFGYTF